MRGRYAILILFILQSFEKAIKSNMEQELASHAVTKGSKPLAMVKFDEHEKKGGNKNRQDKKKGR